MTSKKKSGKCKPRVARVKVVKAVKVAEERHLVVAEIEIEGIPELPTVVDGGQPVEIDTNGTSLAQRATTGGWWNFLKSIWD